MRINILRMPLRRGAFAALFLAALAGPERAKAAAPPGSPLALVPADAVGFAHVKLAEIWKSELVAPFRASFEKAGPKALAAMEEQLDPPPSAFDSLTGFALKTERTKTSDELGVALPKLMPFAVLSFNKPIDREKLVKLYFPEAKSMQIAGKTVYTNLKEAIYFPSDRQVMFSMMWGIDQYLSKAPTAEGGMRAAIDLAAHRPVVIAGNFASLPLPPELTREVPADLLPLLKAQTLTLSLELQGEPKLHLAAAYKDAASASDAEKAIVFLKKMAKEQIAKTRQEVETQLYEPKKPRRPDEYPEVMTMVMMLGALKSADEFIDNPGIRKDGLTLVIDVTIPKDMVAAASTHAPMAAGLLIPAFYKVRSAASRTRSMNNMKQIMIAIHNYYDANGTLPENIKDKDGKPILSWRVAILPYLEQTALHNQFKLDEAWDSPANKKLSQMAIKIYVDPESPVAKNADGYGLTNYIGIAGPGTVFDPKGGVRLTHITDGTSNTLALVNTPRGVPWAKPDDFDFDPAKPVPDFCFPGKGTFNVAFADGSVRSLPKSVKEATLKALFTRAGGEVVDLNESPRPTPPFRK